MKIPARWVLRLASLALALASPVLARPVEVVTAEPFTTWRDPLVLVIRGESSTPCGAAAVSVVPGTVDVDAFTIQAQLLESCPVGGDTESGEPFEVRAHFGLVPAGDWTIFISDAAEGSSDSDTVVVHDLGQLDLDFPEPVLAGSPVQLRVRGFAECAAAHAGAQAFVSPGLIEVVATSACLPITNPPGGYFSRTVQLPPLAPGDYAVRAITNRSYSWNEIQESTLRVWDPELCVPSDTSLCLHGGRFRVTAEWRDFDGNEGPGHASPLAGNDTTGLLWFFGEDNAELTVKVLQGCVQNDHWWVFLSSASTVAYEVSVTDMRTGFVKRYENALGNTPRLIADTSALPDCLPGD